MIKIKSVTGAELDIVIMDKRKTRQQLNIKKCITPLSDKVARVETIIIGVLFHS